MVYCCVPYCKSRSGDKNRKGNNEISFHEFPTSTEFRNKWIKNIARKDWEPSERQTVCSKHFSISQFKVGIKRRRLVPEAVPTIFEGYPSYFCPKQNRKAPCDRNSPPQIKKRKLEGLNESDTIQPICDAEDTNASGIPSTAPDNMFYERRIKTMERMIYKLKAKIEVQENELKEMQSALEAARPLLEKIAKIEDAASDNQLNAVFLMCQINSFGSSHPCWDEKLIRHFILWRALSPKGYEFPRQCELLQLPHETTLGRYMGYKRSNVGMSSLVLERLQQEARLLSDEAKHASIIIDEMAIQPQQHYNRQRDCIIGNVDMGELGTQDVPANRLLCFLLYGLSTKYKIPISYFFTYKLTGNQLYDLTLLVIKAAESNGFKVTRIVTDASTVNVKMLKLLSNGCLRHEITHPLDSERKIFLSFDYCHIIKNVRNNFLSRELMIDGEPVSKCHLRYLFEHFKNDALTPVRYLTTKHVYPNNLEKMNVKRAVQVFMPPVTAALNCLNADSSQPLFYKKCSGTIQFMEIMYKWFLVHNVNNWTKHIHTRMVESAPYTEVTDERLEWMESEFIKFMNNWKKHATAPMHCLSDETFTAMTITTLSTASCIRYLITKCGFKFVLSSRFSSDPIEALFSSVRQMLGRNDQGDAVGVTQALEKILKIGISKASIYGNVKQPSVIEAMFTSTKLSDHASVSSNVQCSSLTLDANCKSLLSKVENPPILPHQLMTTKTIAFYAGFLARYICDKMDDCKTVSEILTVPSTASPLYSLIYYQDRGGLCYPAARFVYLVATLVSAVKALVLLIGQKNLMEMITKVLLPHLHVCGLEWLKCIQCNPATAKIHSEKLLNLIVERIVYNIIDNDSKKKANEVNNRKKFTHVKPLSRKVLKLS